MVLMWLHELRVIFLQMKWHFRQKVLAAHLSAFSSLIISKHLALLVRNEKKQLILFNDYQL